jgi:hypothetical protein
MENITIRAVQAEEFAVAVKWATAEGWNPGVDDLEAFYAADPGGFFMGFKNGAPISSISVVRYGAIFGFLGFYIVHSAHRGTGAGIATWKAGMAHLSDRTVGLDGVVDQQENYRKSGFEWAGRNVRFTGVPHPFDGSDETVTTDEIEHAQLPDVLAYDRQFFPADRGSFLTNWVMPNTAQSRGRRRSFVVRGPTGIIGIATGRKCAAGYKIGPLFAEDKAVARALIRPMVEMVPAGEAISLDVPETNLAGTAIARELGLVPVFETARMYRGTVPALPIDKIFGVTTFELG